MEVVRLRQALNQSLLPHHPHVALHHPPPEAAVVVGPHAPAAADAPPAAGFKARPGERVLELWAGRFQFSEVAPSDHLVGYGVYCGRHVNADGTAASTPCQKHVTIGKAD